MRFRVTPQLLEEADRFQLRSACCDCRYLRRRDGSCSLGWPNAEQRRWPLGAPGPDGTTGDAEFCKEFELA